MVTAVLHHFCVPVTLQSQNIINVNNPIIIKMMANFQKKFPTIVPKALICWKFDWEGKVSKASATKHQLTENEKLILEFDFCHQIESLKNFNKTYGTWLIVVLYIISKKILKEKNENDKWSQAWNIMLCAEIKKQQQQLKILTPQLKNVEFKEG